MDELHDIFNNNSGDNEQNAEREAADDIYTDGSGAAQSGRTAGPGGGDNVEGVREGGEDVSYAPSDEGGTKEGAHYCGQYIETDEGKSAGGEERRASDEKTGGNTDGALLREDGVKKKNSRPISKGVIAACMVGALVLGMAGGAITTRVMLKNDASLEPKVIYQAVETNFEGQPMAESQTLSVEDIAALVSDSVVEITTEKTMYDYWFGQYATQGAGSGVIISENGYIITNNHVINGASKITVTLTSGEQYDATLIGSDEQSDIAVVKIDADGLMPAIYGDSDTLKVGSPIVAIGNPLGQLGGTVTEGIVSALDREIVVEGHKMNLMQISASINRGNSGGGLFDGKGQLIGIVNAKSAGTSIEGLGFAIPINDVKEVVENIMNEGRVPGRAVLDVTVIDINDVRTAMSYRVQEYGVYLLEVTPGGTADAAGLEAGDYIVSFDGTEVSDGTQLKGLVEKHVQGDTAKMVVKRGDETLEVDITFK